MFASTRTQVAFLAHSQLLFCKEPLFHSALFHSAGNQFFHRAMTGVAGEGGGHDDERQQQQDGGAATLLRQRKQKLRKDIRSKIKSAYPPSGSARLEAQSNAVFARLFEMPAYQSATSIGFFLSMPSGEIQTRDAIRRIVQDGKTLYVPRVGLDFEKCDMDLIRCDTTVRPGGDELFYDCWPRNKWNIPEPPTDLTAVAGPGDIDLLLTPGLAFDSRLHRLGQGKGYYDRFIAKTKDENKPILVGVCLEEQFIEVSSTAGSEEGIPMAEYDFVMDKLLTPTKTIE